MRTNKQISNLKKIRHLREKVWGMEIFSLIGHLSKSRIKASKKIFILMLICCVWSFFSWMCAKVQEGERLGTMSKGYDHLENNKLSSLTSCPEDALESKGSFLVGLMAICIFMNCQTWLPKVMILWQWNYDKKMTKRFDFVLEIFIRIVRKCEEFETIGNENRYKISNLKFATVWHYLFILHHHVKSQQNKHYLTELFCKYCLLKWLPEITWSLGHLLPIMSIKANNKQSSCCATFSIMLLNEEAE